MGRSLTPIFIKNKKVREGVGVEGDGDMDFDPAVTPFRITVKMA
jgi:uncharacterized protein YigE (DUF2233 family)